MIFDILQTIIMPEQNFLSRHMTGAGASDLPGVYLQEVLHRVADVLVDRGLDGKCVFLFERGDKLLMLAVYCLYAHDAGHIAFAQGADKHMVIAVKLNSFRVAAAGHYQPVEFRVQVYVAGAERLTGGDKADLLIYGLELVYKLIVYIGQGRFIDKALQRSEQAVYLPDKGL